MHATITSVLLLRCCALLGVRTKNIFSQKTWRGCIKAGVGGASRIQFRQISFECSGLFRIQNQAQQYTCTYSVVLAAASSRKKNFLFFRRQWPFDAALLPLLVIFVVFLSHVGSSRLLLQSLEGDLSRLTPPTRPVSIGTTTSKMLHRQHQH